MKVIVSKTHEESSRKLVDMIEEQITKKKDSLICLAGGETPMLVYKMISETKVDVSEVKFVSLDEWGGIGYETYGSCKQTLYDNVYYNLDIDMEKQVVFFDGKADDFEKEVERVNNFVKSHGGLDLTVLGIGMNGHLGFNEPCSDINLEAGVIPLDPMTKEVGKKYFNVELDLEVGLTIGLKTLLESKTLILMANDKKKAPIIKRTVEEDPSVEVPSSLIQTVDNGYLFIDEAAASDLNQ